MVTEKATKGSEIDRLGRSTRSRSALGSIANGALTRRDGGGEAASGTVRAGRNDACIGGGGLPLLLHVVLPSLLSLVMVLQKSWDWT